METKNIKQTITFKASPEEVYELIMDSKKHTAFSGAEAKMSKKLKGEFATYDGYCSGHNIELEPGKKIVQAWHFEEDGWPETHFSICTFILKKKENDTKLTFTQTGIPAHKAEALKTGWKEFYWDLMKEYLKK